jgi:O-antigen/teichoic acid export membrane protein
VVSDVVARVTASGYGASDLRGRLGQLVRHRVAQASALRAIALAVGLGASVVIARAGGPDVKGATSAFAAAAVLAFTVVNLDLAQQLLQECKRRGALNLLHQRVIRLWPTYFILAATVGLAATALEATSVAWLAVGTICYLMSAQLGFAANGLSGPAVTAWGGILQQIGLVVSALAFWFADALSVASAPAVVAISFVFPLPLYVIANRRAIAGLPAVDAGGVRTPILRIALLGMRWQPGRMAQMLLLRLDTIVVFWVIGADDAGRYSVGLATAALAGVVPAQFAANALYEATHDRIGSMRRNSLFALASGVFGGLLLILAGKPLIHLLYGTSFADAYGVMVATLLGTIAFGILQVFTNQMRVTGRAIDVAIPSLAGAVAMSVGLLILIPLAGVVGAGMASSLGSAVAVLVAVVQRRRRRPTGAAAGQPAALGARDG